MANLLIVYASHFGQTRAIAHEIADKLRLAHHDVEIVDARRAEPPPPGMFDAVVLGSRVEIGRHAPEIREYMAHHREALRDMPVAVFSVSMAASSPNAGTDPSGYLSMLFEEVGWKPTIAIALAGALPYRKYNWLLRLVMKRISRSAGHTTDTSRNHEFTDWPRVRELAHEIAAIVPPPGDVASDDVATHDVAVSDRDLQRSPTKGY
jgi:menaquinone-dependent protoporphyrinogen oxidase